MTITTAQLYSSFSSSRYFFSISNSFKASWVTSSTRRISPQMDLKCPDSRRRLITTAGSTGRCNTLQRVDSTMLAKENHLFGCDLLKPSQGSLSTDLTLASDSSLYFHCRLGSSKCCVDLLRPPRLPGAT